MIDVLEIELCILCQISVGYYLLCCHCIGPVQGGALNDICFGFATKRKIALISKPASSQINDHKKQWVSCTNFEDWKILKHFFRG